MPDYFSITIHTDQILDGHCNPQTHEVITEEIDEGRLRFVVRPRGVSDLPQSTHRDLDVLIALDNNATNPL